MRKKLCTIVGMGPGISLSVARQFAANDFVIAMIARNADKLKNYQNELAQEELETHPFPADVSNFEQLKSAFDQVHQKLGPTDVLIYNVSVFREATPTELNPEVACEDFRVNVAGALVAIQAVAGLMKDQQKGSIFLTGGGQAIKPYPPFSSLAIGKAGIRNLTHSAAGELEPFGIHVATITINGAVMPHTKFAPELIAKEFWRLYQQQSKDQFQREVIFE